MARGRSPVFVSVTVCGALVVFTWVKKFKAVGETLPVKA
jgi:hypothetical protein